MGKKKNYSTYLMFVAGLVIFGSNGIVSSFIGLGSQEIVFWRTLLGMISLLLIFLVTGNKFTFRKYKKDLFYVALSGIAMGTCWLFLFEAYVRIGVGLSSLLYYCGPIIVMALSPILFKEKLTSAKLVGFVAVLAGIVLVNGNVFMEGGSFIGLACGGVTMFLYAALVISSKFVEHIDGMEKSFFQVLFSFLTVFIYLLVTSNVPTSFPWTTGFRCWLSVFLTLASAATAILLPWASCRCRLWRSVAIWNRSLR